MTSCSQSHIALNRRGQWSFLPGKISRDSERKLGFLAYALLVAPVISVGSTQTVAVCSAAGL